jgi:hypothetical protein
MLRHVSSVEQQGSARGDQERLSQPDLTHELRGDTERQDQQSDELEQATDPIPPR